MNTLRSQLSLTIMLIVAFTVTIISFFSNRFFQSEFEKYIENQQKERVNDIVSSFLVQHYDMTEEWDVQYIHGMGMYALLDGYMLDLYDRNGSILWSAENHDMTMCHQVMDSISNLMEKRMPHFEGKFNSHQYELRNRSGQKVGTLSLSYYSPYFLTENDFAFIDTLNMILMLVCIFSLGVSLVIGSILARNIANPITRVINIAKQISMGNFHIHFEGNPTTKELKELTTAINCLSDELAKQENLRKRLTVNIAHELRTPLTTLRAYLESMVEGVWNPTTERLQSCYEEAGRLASLVDDLSDLSKIESDNLILNKEYVDLMEMVYSCCNIFEVEIKKKKIDMEVKGNQVFVFADKDKITQVMVNLISNAVKYTLDQGHIIIEIGEWDQEVVLVVEDDGIGISKKDLTLVFERFYRTDISRSRETGGAGIGLSITKSIIVAHGGKIWVESDGKQGSRFVVTLPKEE